MCATGPIADARTVNLQAGLWSPTGADLAPLRRFDIVYAPRTGLSSAGVLMSQIKDLIPGDVASGYAVTNGTRIFQAVQALANHSRAARCASATSA